MEDVLYRLKRDSMFLLIVSFNHFLIRYVKSVGSGYLKVPDVNLLLLPRGKSEHLYQYIDVKETCKSV